MGQGEGRTLPGAFATSGASLGASCGPPASMALHQIYSTDWGQTIDETVRQDETSRRLAETGEEAVIAERAARCGWRLSWQSCDVRAAKCAPQPPEQQCRVLLQP